MSYFYDGVTSFFWLDTGVGGTSLSSKYVPGVPLTRTHNISVRTRRLQNKRPLAVLPCLLYKAVTMPVGRLFTQPPEKTNLTKGAVSNTKKRFVGIICQKDPA